MNRREFLRLAGMSALSGASLLSGCAPAMERTTAPLSSSGNPARFSLRIAPVKIDLSPKQTIETIGYNGSSPGPLLRVVEGQQVIVDVKNDSEVPELVHWHGFYVPSEVDGSMEEGTPMVAVGGSRQYSFTAQPSGTRWYHTHAFAGNDLRRSLYSGQFGFFYVEPKSNPGNYDQEVFLAAHQWEPEFVSMQDIRKGPRSEEHTSELRHPSISYAVFCLKKKKLRECLSPSGVWGTRTRVQLNLLPGRGGQGRRTSCLFRSASGRRSCAFFCLSFLSSTSSA